MMFPYVDNPSNTFLCLYICFYVFSPFVQVYVFMQTKNTGPHLQSHFLLGLNQTVALVYMALLANQACIHVCIQYSVCMCCSCSHQSLQCSALLICHPALIASVLLDPQSINMFIGPPPLIILVKMEQKLHFFSL